MSFQKEEPPSLKEILLLALQDRPCEGAVTARPYEGLQTLRAVSRQRRTKLLGPQPYDPEKLNYAAHHVSMKETAGDQSPAEIFILAWELLNTESTVPSPLA